MKQRDLNRSKRKATARGIHKLAFILFIVGIFANIRIFNVSLVVFAIILWITGSTISSILYPKRISEEVYPMFNAGNGNPTKSQKACQVCGTLIEDKAEFCIECGAKIEIAQF